MIVIKNKQYHTVLKMDTNFGFYSPQHDPVNDWWSDGSPLTLDPLSPEPTMDDLIHRTYLDQMYSREDIPPQKSPLSWFWKTVATCLNSDAFRKL